MDKMIYMFLVQGTKLKSNLAFNAEGFAYLENEFKYSLNDYKLGSAFLELKIANKVNSLFNTGKEIEAFSLILKYSKVKYKEE